VQVKGLIAGHGGRVLDRFVTGLSATFAVIAVIAVIGQQRMPPEDATRSW
jgi:hypothetical protein